MAVEYDFELDPASFMTIGAIGPPGERTFYLQAAHGTDVVSVIIEKEQAAALAASIERLLVALEKRDPDHATDLKPLDTNMGLLQPVRSAFRATQLGIGVEEERHVIVIVAHEDADDGPGLRARFVCTYELMLTVARRAIEVIRQGRPVCELCGQAIGPDGHFCPRRNGHHPLAQRD